jgi:hypothetical protein
VPPPESGAFSCTEFLAVIKTPRRWLRRYCIVLIDIMKVRIKRSVMVEVEKTKLNEVWDKQLSRWDELNVADMDVQGRWANLITVEGDVYLSVPIDAYEVVA